MAASFIIDSADTGAITNALNKNIITFYNTSSSLVTRIYRLWLGNPQTSNVTGAVALLQLGRFDSAVAGTPTAITPQPLDPSATTLTGLTVSTGGTLVTLSSTFMQFARATDETSAGGSTMDEIHNIVPLNLIWDSGYRDADVEPITLRENEGLALVTGPLGTATGSFYVFAEFTHS